MSRLSLAQKYEQAKSGRAGRSSVPPRVRDLENDILSEINAPRIPYIGDLNIERAPASPLFKHTPPASSSPIKTIRFSGNSVRPSRIYKAAGTGSKYARKNPGSRSNPGFFERLRSFLSTAASNELKALRGSAQELVGLWETKEEPNLPKQSKPIPDSENAWKPHPTSPKTGQSWLKTANAWGSINTDFQERERERKSPKKVSFEPSFSTPLKNSMLVSDFDQVDHQLRVNSELRQRQPLLSRIEQLLESLELERRRNNDILETYESRIKRTNREHQEEVGFLQSKVAELQHKLDQLERERQDRVNYRDQVMRENERVLVSQREREDEIKRKQRDLDKQIKDLDKQKKDLDGQKRVLEQNQSQSHNQYHQSHQDQSHDQTSLPLPKQNRLQTPVRATQSAHLSLLSEQESLEYKLQVHQNEFIAFTEKIHALSTKLLAQKHNDLGFWKEVQQLASLEDHPVPKTEQYLLMEEKLQEYTEIFSDPTQNTSESYLDEIERSFLRVKHNLHVKNERKQQKLVRVEQEISQFEFDLNGLKSAINAFHTRNLVLHELQAINRVLLAMEVAADALYMCRKRESDMFEI